jgi:hypothetical protein
MLDKRFLGAFCEHFISKCQVACFRNAVCKCFRNVPIYILCSRLESVI